MLTHSCTPRCSHTGSHPISILRSREARGPSVHLLGRTQPRVHHREQKAHGPSMAGFSGLSPPPGVTPLQGHRTLLKSSVPDHRAAETHLIGLEQIQEEVQFLHHIVLLLFALEDGVYPTLRPGQAPPHRPGRPFPRHTHTPGHTQTYPQTCSHSALPALQRHTLPTRQPSQHQVKSKGLSPIHLPAALTVQHHVLPAFQAMSLSSQHAPFLHTPSWHAREERAPQMPSPSSFSM